MYTSPDLVKVDVSVKDNFAAYSGCTPRYATTFFDAGDSCTLTPVSGELIYGFERGQCYNGNTGN